jgi:broad specificity phosphatase PhoE
MAKTGEETAQFSVWFITHPEVIIDPNKPVPEWSLSEIGVARMIAFCARPELDAISLVYSSAETKAVEGAEILAKHLGLTAQVDEQLHENDRSATGFLPPPEFQKMADRFFASPEISVEGWERAVDAQSRIVNAVRRLATAHDGAGDLAIVAHGGVGALLIAALKQLPISRTLDQPGGGGGNYFVFDCAGFVLHVDWTDIVPVNN